MADDIYSLYTGRNVIKVATMRVKNQDVFSLQAFYNLVHDWCVEEGWGPAKDGLFGEKMFKRYDRPDGKKKDYRIHWRLNKEINDYIKFWMDLDYNILFIEPIEMMHNGKKVKTNKCDCDVNIHVRMEYDVGKKFGNHWLLKNFAKIFPKRIYWKQLEEHRIRCYREAYSLQETMKDFWKFKSWAEEPEQSAYERPLGLPDYEESKQ